MRRSRRLCGVLSNPTGRNEFVFRGALQLEIVIFADRNGNRIFNGEPCFTVVMENLTTPSNVALGEALRRSTRISECGTLYVASPPPPAAVTHWCANGGIFV